MSVVELIEAGIGYPFRPFLLLRNTVPTICLWACLSGDDATGSEAHRASRDERVALLRTSFFKSTISHATPTPNWLRRSGQLPAWAIFSWRTAE